VGVGDTDKTDCVGGFGVVGGAEDGSGTVHFSRGIGDNGAKKWGIGADVLRIISFLYAISPNLGPNSYLFETFQAQPLLFLSLGI